MDSDATTTMPIRLAMEALMEEIAQVEEDDVVRQNQGISFGKLRIKSTANFPLLMGDSANQAGWKSRAKKCAG